MLKFSIITVCRNAAHCIEETIGSVLSQTHPDIEYIIIDGTSTDKTMAIINKYHDRIAKILSEKDNGIYDAMNKGIRLSTGDLVYFLNAGDAFSRKTLLSEVANFWKGEDVLYGDIHLKGDAGKYIVNSRTYTGKIQSARSLFNDMFCQQRAFFKRNLFTDIGMLDTSYKIIADFDIIFKAYQKGCRFSYFPEEVVLYPLGGYGSLYPYRFIWERLRSLNRLPVWQWYWMLDQVINAIARGSFRKYARLMIRPSEKQANSP